MRRLWAFLPYAAVGAIHLVLLYLGSDATSTKALLMPALLAGLLIALPTRRSELALVGSIAIVLSWAGDVFLSSPGNIGFLAGLGFFLLAHAVYIVQFRRSLKERGVPALALVFVAWWVALLVILAPHLGTLLVPVALYGAVLGASAATALGSNRLVAIGALVFLISDTVLAFKMFWPGFSLWQADFIIMLGYITGQGLLALGTVRRARALTGDTVAG